MTKYSLKIFLLFSVLSLINCDSIPSNSPDEDSNSTRLTNIGKIFFFSWHRFSQNIATIYNASLWVIDSETVTNMRLTDIEGTDYNINFLDWSPNGNEIVYQYRDTIQNIDRLKIYSIPNNNHVDLEIDGRRPIWSPKGDSIALYRKNENIVLYSISTSDTTRLFQRTLPFNWSNDESMIVYLEDDDIYIYNTNHETTKKVGEYYFPGGIDNPSFSPSGKYVLFQALAAEEGQNTHLVVLSVLDSSYIHIPFSDHTWFPTWTNEETKIAYMYSQDIWIKDIEEILY